MQRLILAIGPAATPTADLRMRHRGRESGFTLIEVLVVVFIIGVILGFATLSLGGRSLDDRLEQEARRLTEVLRLASEQAIVTSAQIGFRPSENGYEFLTPGEERWVPLEAPRSPFRAHQFEIPAELLLTDAPAALRGDNKDLPAVVFFSSGELTPFEFSLRVEGLDKVERIRGRIDGLITRIGPTPTP